MWPNPQETADLVTLTEEILNGKGHFLCNACSVDFYIKPGRNHSNNYLTEIVVY